LFFVRFVYFPSLDVVSLLVNTSAIDCPEKGGSEITYYVSSGTLTLAQSLIRFEAEITQLCLLVKQY